MMMHFEDDYMDEDMEDVLVMKKNKAATSVKHVDKIRDFFKSGKKKEKFAEFVKKKV